MTKNRCSLLAAGLLLIVPRLLFAQPAASEDASGQSRLHFDRGVLLYREGSLDSALAEFSRAYELVRDYRLLYNVAQVQIERHDYVAAIEVFGDYLKQGGSAIPRDRRAEVDSETARLRQRVGELWISANAPGAEVSINGRLAGKLPLSGPILVNGGPCSVRITHTGYKPFTRDLQVVGGERPRLELELARETSAGTSETPRLVRNNVWLWLSLTATGAFTAGSVTFGLLARNANETLDRRLNEYPPEAGRIDEARKALRTEALACDLLAGAAVIGAGTSLYFLLTPSYETSAKSGSNTQGPTARFVPSPTGLLLDGTF